MVGGKSGFVSGSYLLEGAVYYYIGIICLGVLLIPNVGFIPGGSAFDIAAFALDFLAYHY
jgi:hypothetical protein